MDDHQQLHAHAYSDPDAHSNPDADTHSDADPNTDSDTHSDADPNADSDAVLHGLDGRSDVHRRPGCVVSRSDVHGTRDA